MERLRLIPGDPQTGGTPLRSEEPAKFRLYWLRRSEEASRTRAIGRREAVKYFFDEASFDHLRTRFEPLAADETFEVVNT